MIRSAADLLAGGDAGYDVCIVGAGAAGIPLALELAERGRRVCVLEAGGETYTAGAQALMEGDVLGDPYPPLRSTRLSALGGSTRVWAGWCRPLDPIDFEPRPALGGPGWPFDRDALLPYYHRAHAACGLAAFDYDAEEWARALGREPLPTGGGSLIHRIFHVRAASMAALHRPRLEAAVAVDIWLNAPVTRLELDDGGAARGARVRRPDGRDAVVRARTFVLAAGGVENPRLLMLSAEDPGRAPGNGHGLLGRFFSDHAYVNPGWMVLDAPRRLGLYFPQPVRRGSQAGVRAALALSRDVVEGDGLPGSALFFHPRHEAHPVFDAPEVRAFLELREKLRSRAVPGAMTPLVARALRRPDRIAVAAARKLLFRGGAARRWRIRMMFETASRAENRVELDPAPDPLGRPRPRVRWRLDDAELDGMRRTLDRFDAELRRAGVGRIVRSLPDAHDAWRAAREAGKHHMGATRMHADPARGVVDAQGRVHGTPNLFVTGSSVFPSTGYANPTLTIVALAIRLADHIAER